MGVRFRLCTWSYDGQKAQVSGILHGCYSCAKKLTLPSNAIAGSRGCCGAHQWWTNAEPQMKGKKNLVEHVLCLPRWWRWWGGWWWSKMGTQCQTIPTIYSQCNGCFSLQTLDVEKRVILLLATDQSWVKAGMICFITIHGVQVLAFETIASG